MSTDLTVFNAVHSLAGASPFLDIEAIFLARFFPYFLIAAFFVFLAFQRNWRLRFYYFALAALATIISRGIILETIRIIHFRARPPVVLSFEPLIPFDPAAASFPSGHASFFFALATAIFLVNRRWGLWFFAGALLMGVARIFVGVHWPSDIIAGAILGIATAIITDIAFFGKIKTTSSPPAGSQGLENQITSA
jgi:undecaprenyl-diphosphatase